MECNPKIQAKPSAMNNRPAKSPPKILLHFFRWFCHPDFQEEIEGDLTEQFYKNQQLHGYRKACGYFVLEVLLLLRPSVAGYSLTQNTTSMKAIQWMKLGLINVALILLCLIPFVPGPYTRVASAITTLVQSAGFFGLLIIPVSIFWLIAEIKSVMQPQKERTHWTSGYYLAIAAAIVFVCMSGLILFLLVHNEGVLGGVFALLIISSLLIIFLPRIKKLKLAATGYFNPAPLYLLSIPVIVFIIRLYMFEPLCDYSRSVAINRSASLITAIEAYKAQTGIYPESLDTLAGTFLPAIPKPGVMGIDQFRYERNFDGTYALWFVQWQHFSATKEIVMFNKEDSFPVKGHFAAFYVDQPHWRYYWLD
jgi:hypothetical protein